MPSEPSSRAKAAIATDGRVMSKRILIVNDQQSVVMFLHEILEQLGFEVSSAPTGTEGIALFQKCGIDGIILDLP